MPEAITDLLNYEIFGGVTVVHVIAAVVSIVILSIIWKKLFTKKERPDVYEKIKCQKCGWEGEVSKYHAVCRRCGAETVKKLTGV